MIEPQLDRRALRSVDSWAGTVVSNAWGCDYCLKPNQGGLRSPPRGLAIVLARGLGSFGLAAGSSDITTGLKIITDGRRATRGGEGQAAGATVSREPAFGRSLAMITDAEWIVVRCRPDLVYARRRNTRPRR